MVATPRGPLQTLIFAVLVAVVCGALVSAVSVWLAPRQVENERREREAVLQSLLECDPELAGRLERAVGSDAACLEARVVDLDSGCYLPGADAACFDPAGHLSLSPDQDLASIGERPNHVVVYEVRRDGEIALLMLPVYGAGYQSRLEGFLSLGPDLGTVVSLVFYRHGETPGMGARVGDPEWQARWQGKRTRDAAGQLRIGVRTRGGEDASPYEIDAMSGATRTGIGVTNLLRFWLGDTGYAPLIGKLQSGAACTNPGA